nr:methyltransferase-like protein 7A [Parasteatoda tepidariorum]
MRAVVYLKKIEVAVYLILSMLLWFLSFSVFLPFVISLVLSKTASHLWFSYFFSKFLMPLFGFMVLSKRRQLFNILKEHLSNRNKAVPLEILEIGIGPGSNLRFYPENSNLTALDVNPSFIEIFNKNKKYYPQISFKRTVLNFGEDMKDINDSSFDVVISTHTLCSVKNVELVIKEVKRVLKTGGKYIFMEHVVFPKNEGGYLIQNLMDPLWPILFGGCHVNRDITGTIKNAGFSDLHHDVSYPVYLPIWFRPHLIGIATK